MNNKRPRGVSFVRPGSILRRTNTGDRWLTGRLAEVGCSNERAEILRLAASDVDAIHAVEEVFMDAYCRREAWTRLLYVSFNPTG